MELMARQGINENGNVALELVVAVALSVTFLFPSIEIVSQIFRSNTEVTEAISTLARTFQVSPYERVKENLSEIRIALQRESKNNLRIFLQFRSNSDGIIDTLEINAVAQTNGFGVTTLSDKRTIKRAVHVS
jgi:hypothetical protein